MDIITASLFKKFKELYGYSNKEEAEAFELFSIYCVAANLVKDTISKEILEEIRIGGNGDCGIDGFLVVINGKIVTNVDMANDLIEANNIINVQIALIQAKTSESINCSEVGVFLNGIEFITKSITSKGSLPTMNDELKNYINVLKLIYGNSSKLVDNKNPKLYCYYTYCGTYQRNNNVEALIEKTREAIDKEELYSDFCFDILDHKKIVTFYRNTKEKLEVKITVDKKLSLLKLDKVTDAYLCIIPYCEICKLFIDNNNKIREEVFNDNVRAYLGPNLVNKTMRESLQNSDNINLFPAMNNGITVIAERIHVTSESLTLTNFQIVNGCQTCNVLFEANEYNNIEKLEVVVKVIVSEDKTIRDKIIIANNSQTEVKREQLMSLLDTQREIEDYYNAQSKYVKLYYERRAKQYMSPEVCIPQDKIITIPNQILSFVSMILGKPNKVRGYYWRIVQNLKDSGTDVFEQNKYSPALYYTCALASYQMTELFSSRMIDRKYRKIKFQILYAFRLLCEASPMPAFNSNKIQNYCDALCDVLCDKDLCYRGFCSAIKLIDEILNREPNDSDQQSWELTNSIHKNAIYIRHKKKNYRKI